MGMIGVLIRVSPEKLESFMEDSSRLEDLIYGEDLYESDSCLDLDKNWEGIHFILSGESMAEMKGEPNKLSRAFFSNQLVDGAQDLGYGPAHFLTEEQVKETFEELKEIDIAHLKENLKGSDLTQKGIYPSVWDEPEAIAWLIDSFTDFKEFYAKADMHNQAIVTYVS